MSVHSGTDHGQFISKIERAGATRTALSENSFFQKAERDFGADGRVRGGVVGRHGRGWRGVTPRSIVVEAAISLILIVAARGASRPVDLNPVIPDSVGVNTHFLDPNPGEMEMLAAAGIRWARTDFGWEETEKKPGQYDFSGYDKLVNILESYNVSPYLILDYTNKLYDNGMSPYTEEGRQAFTRWAAAAVKHFQGRGIIWEMYNEPNIKVFWLPKPNVQDYIKLALEVGKAIRTVAPSETYIGPAVSTIDFPFLEACFKAGLLNYWSAVSVHPYRRTDPESAAAEYSRLHHLIEAYAPEGRKVPILAGEWGYSTVWKGMDDEKQGKLLAREILSNLANGLPLTIWYDWHDDGSDPKDPEDHFGTVYFPYERASKAVYRPKPAYIALQNLTHTLAGYRYSKRLPVGSANDYVLLFSKGENVRLAAWTTSSAEHKVFIPVGIGGVSIADYRGQNLKMGHPINGKLAINLTDAPQYLVPERPDKKVQ
jgi:polysaccharide biosynthesis protein PslG